MSANQLIVVAAFIAAWSVQAAAADEPQAKVDSARAEAISHKIDELSAQLDALDQAVARIRQIRNDEIPALMKQAPGAAESSVLKKSEDSAEQSAATPPSDGAAKADAMTPALEAQWESIRQRLHQLDDLTQQAAAIRNEEIPKVKGELNRLAGRTIVARPILPGASGQGRLVINNRSQLTRDVTVNGITYTFAPGQWQVPVMPYQDVMTTMSAGDIPRLWGRTHWRESASGPEMRLELR